jgi:hypothetical protein
VAAAGTANRGSIVNIHEHPRLRGAVDETGLNRRRHPEVGCQREIAQKIIDKKADYILALKGNQGSFRDDVELFVAEQKAVGFSDAMVSHSETH